MADKPRNIHSFSRPDLNKKQEVDPFPQKRPPIKKAEEAFDIKYYEHVISQVVQLLMTKATHEGRKQDKYNPTMLGNVSFYLDYNDITKATRLVFDKNPKMWNEKDIIDEAHNIEADIMMEKEAQQDILDNPFTY